MANPLKQILKQMKDQDRKQRTENFAVNITGISVLVIMILVIMIRFIS